MFYEDTSKTRPTFVYAPMSHGEYTGCRASFPRSPFICIKYMWYRVTYAPALQHCTLHPFVFIRFAIRKICRKICIQLFYFLHAWFWNEHLERFDKLNINSVCFKHVLLNKNTKKSILSFYLFCISPLITHSSERASYFSRYLLFRDCKIHFSLMLLTLRCPQLQLGLNLTYILDLWEFSSTCASLYQ